MERCLIYTNLAKAYALNKQLDKAKEIINKSIGEFAGTDQEMNVLLANSEIAIESNDIKKALSILRAVNVESHYYSQSRKLMAEVYLTHLKDRRNYTKCYTDLVESNPTFENYKLLGKAML
jgi:tetratricopeptide repeat protein 21B